MIKHCGIVEHAVSCSASRSAGCAWPMEESSPPASPITSSRTARRSNQVLERQAAELVRALSRESQETLRASRIRQHDRRRWHADRSAASDLSRTMLGRVLINPLSVSPLRSESDRSAALPRIDAMCHKPTPAPQQNRVIRLPRPPQCLGGRQIDRERVFLLAGRPPVCLLYATHLI